MSDSDPSGNIYLTAKARMVAESRLKRAETMSQILMAWYSVCLIGLSLLDMSQNFRVRDVSIMTAILSVAVLVTTIFLSSRNFSIRAASFRDCYLKLQQIYWSQATAEEKAGVYANTLPMFENHLQRDYEWVLFQSWILGKSLSDANGAVVPSRLVITKCLVIAILRLLALFMLFLSPLLLGYILVLPQ